MIRCPYCNRLRRSKNIAAFPYSVYLGEYIDPDPTVFICLECMAKIRAQAFARDYLVQPSINSRLNLNLNLEDDF
jgi:DNA-directed RNA polymerase subunit RPC12/RpoP